MQTPSCRTVTLRDVNNAICRLGGLNYRAAVELLRRFGAAEGRPNTLQLRREDYPAVLERARAELARWGEPQAQASDQLGQLGRGRPIG